MSEFVPVSEMKSQAALERAPSITPDASAPAELDRLSLEERLALLQMSSRSFDKAIYWAMRQEIQIPPFTASTFASLRDLKLAQRLTGERFHSLTIQGSTAAGLIAMRYQSEQKFHIAYFGGAEGPSVTLRCTCGWSCGLRRGHSTDSQAMIAMSSHLRTVQAVSDMARTITPHRASA